MTCSRPLPRGRAASIRTATASSTSTRFAESEEGAGARLTKWLEYGGGLLDEDEVRLPGSPTTYANGDECPDGEVGEVQVFVNGERVAEYEDYIPQDGDRIAIGFGPERDFGRRR